jgi:hypothetical protein
MKFGNPKRKSHNVQMNIKPIKDLKNMPCAKNVLKKKKKNTIQKHVLKKKCNFKLFKSP